MLFNIQNKNNIKKKDNNKNNYVEIIKINKQILENNLFEDFNKEINNIYQKNKDQKLSNEFEKKIIKQIKKINIDYNTNIQKIKKKINKIKIKEKKTNIKNINNLQEQKNYIISKHKINYNKINNSIQKKQKIYYEFQQKIEKIKNEYKNYLNRIEKVKEKIIFDKKEQEKEIFEKKEKISKKTNKEKQEINVFFNKKFFDINNKINELKKEHKNNIKNIKNNYETTKKEIKEKQKEELLKINNNKINIFFENELKEHNKILIEQKKEFIKNNDYLNQKEKKLFIQEKLKTFFILQPIQKINYQNFIKFMNEILQNEFFKIKKTFLWRKKYIFFKYFYNHKLNLIYIDKNFLEKKYKNKINNKILEEEKKKEILKHDLFKKLNCLELELRIIETEKKYKIIEINSSEDLEKNELEFILEKKSILENLKLKNLNFQKEINILINEQEKKNALLKMQIEIEKTHLKSDFLKEIIKKQEKIEKLENEIINLKNNQEYQIQKQNMIFEKNKQNFLKRHQLKKIKFQYLIEKYLDEKTKKYDYLNIFAKYINKKKTKEKILFQNIENKLNSFLYTANNQKNFFSLKEFDLINQSFQFFIDKIKDIQFNHYYLWIEQFYLLNKTKIQTKISLNKNLTEYYEKNIFLLKNLINENKKSDDFIQNKILFTIENKMKKYENFYTIFKKQYSQLINKEKENEIYYQNKIQQLKNTQNKKIIKNNFYQKKIFIYLEIIEKIENNEKLYKKILLWFYKKKIFNYWFLLCKNIKSFYPKIDLNYLQQNIQQENKKDNLNEYEDKINFVSNLYENIAEQIHNLKIENIKNKLNKKKINLIKQINILKKMIDIQLNEMKDKIYLLKINLEDAKENNKNYFFEKIKKIKQIQNKEKNSLIHILNIKENIYQKTIFLEKNKNKINKKEKQKEQKKIFHNFNLIQNQYLKNKKKIEKKIKKINKNTSHKIFILSQQKKISFLLSKISHWWKYIKEKKDLKKNTKQNRNKIKKRIKQNIILYKKFYNFFKN
ncbi:MAG: hypothetical protein BGWL_c0370 [Candidatus Phytoplasma cynodontis]|uniref:hypothetical protein n=1 Tax='Cynodon dactylon' phytoplasma TaxID=295320 RepID=UPI001265BD60|nr:hypothetical protein ['Cynodon dactylon' phytoplasma]KAB8122056.1 hypothetical protein F1741_00745 ['Cynodon dactylon' phytoplasma]WIA07529.1 MAG: hypothetical protein BGWL_c0370 [Candidatus Phytoplasma cynodontis]